MVVRPQRVPLLTKNHITKRIEWAHNHARDNWSQTIFSDETTFQMFRNTQQVRVKCRKPRPSKPMVKHPYKVHLWGAFSKRGPIGFYLFTGRINAKKYCEILTEKLFPNASRAGRQWHFQQDNAHNKGYKAFV